MQYKIVGNTMPAVEILFDQPGESMYTQSGGMAWMSDGVKLDTNTRGGLFKGVGRMFALHGKLYRKQAGSNDCICLYGGR